MTEKTSSTLTLEHLWQFSLRYYSAPEVKEACLALQNRYQGNINLLLLLKWLDEQKLGFNSHSWNRVQQALIRSENLLQQYRELRKKLKLQTSPSLYRESLEFELLLEKEQQSDLVACINQLPLLKNSDKPLTQIYCQQLGAAHLYSTFSH